jgi:hypothetical protein
MTNKSPVREAIENAISAHEEDDAYELALGRLTIAWADVEQELYRVLVNYSQVSDAVARAIFSGTRASVMIDFINAIAENTDMDQSRLDDLKYVFPQIKTINTVRDMVTHNSTSSYSYPASNPKQRLVTNQPRSSRYGSHKEHLVSAETMDAMTWDLHGIANHLNMHWGPRTGPFQKWEENPGEQTTWLYKSPQPINKQGRSRKDSHKPQDHQKSSGQKH